MTLACGKQMEEAGDIKTDVGQAWSLKKRGNRGWQPRKKRCQGDQTPDFQDPARQEGLHLEPPLTTPQARKRQESHFSPFFVF